MRVRKCKQVVDFDQSTTTMREERRIHHWINQAKYFTIYQSYIIKVKINRFSPRHMLLFQVKGDRATMQHIIHLQSKWISSMACALVSYCVGSPLSAIRLKIMKEK